MGLIVLVVGDLHGDWTYLWRALESERPDLILSVGDWGDPDEVSEADFRHLLDRVPIYTVFGNHDDLSLLASLKNRDGSPILIANGSVVQVGDAVIAGISGIWAKSKRKPYYITNEEIVGAAQVLQDKGVSIFITHGCPIGLADLTPKGSHGGQRAFLEAFRLVKPKLYLCGHLHRPQMRTLKSGQIILNVGTTAQGDYAVVRIGSGSIDLIKRVVSSQPAG
ncbi:MAG: metallophosphoesterase [Armatimonadetes bacterium]|nr:metallophosphoesterase [Armatimonadota bacterium]MDW8122608.1 metallophosphoesterase [Armatimonadota bacterium]